MAEKKIVHFSCGAASAVSALIVLLENSPKDVELVYTDPRLEHPDNRRFLHDFERFAGEQVTILQSTEFHDPFSVFESRRFLRSSKGAPCTTELKKATARQYLGVRLLEEVSVFGFDFSSKELKRAERYVNNNPELDCYFPLIEHEITKKDCFYILSGLGLDLPYMYKLGYKNSNCTGCVKVGSLGYWAAIREDFPEVFAKYSLLEREFGRKDEKTGDPIGHSLNTKMVKGRKVKVFLDEIPVNQKPKRNVNFTCGYSCGEQDMEVSHSDKFRNTPTDKGIALLDRLLRSRYGREEKESTDLFSISGRKLQGM
jgi:3'-phosphoadenosine 5'-phosphosulfate sulfotransferase (PAPS reductase)/FAD synthetase